MENETMLFISSVNIFENKQVLSLLKAHVKSFDIYYYSLAISIDLFLIDD